MTSLLTDIFNVFEESSHAGNMIWGLKILTYILWVCHEVHQKNWSLFYKDCEKVCTFTLEFLSGWLTSDPKLTLVDFKFFWVCHLWTCVQEQRIVRLICMVFRLLYEISIKQFGSNPGRHRYTIQDIIQKQSNYGFWMALWIAFRWLSIFHQ